MKRILVILSAISSIILFSCQKEVDYANNGGTTTNNGTGLLAKIVSKTGSDSSVLSFSYNASKKIITLKQEIESGGNSILIQQKVERNAQGIIQRHIIKSPLYQQAGFDSIVTVVKYNSGKYTAKVTAFDLGLIILKDSTVLIYDGSGKVVTEKSYSDFGGGAYEESSKIEYTYSGSNIASIKYYSYDASTSSYTLDETYTYDEYDSKVSPMYMGDEAFIFDSAPFYSSNNITKSSVTAGGSTENYTTTYTYNTSSKPVTATSIIQPGNITSTGTYYYQ